MTQIVRWYMAWYMKHCAETSYYNRDKGWYRGRILSAALIAIGLLLTITFFGGMALLLLFSYLLHYPVAFMITIVAPVLLASGIFLAIRAEAGKEDE